MLWFDHISLTKSQYRPCHGRNKGGKGGTIPRAPNHWGAPKKSNNVA